MSDKAKIAILEDTVKHLEAAYIAAIKERDEARAEATVNRLMLEQYKKEVAEQLQEASGD